MQPDSREHELEEELAIARETLSVWTSNFENVGRDRHEELENEVARLSAQLERLRTKRRAFAQPADTEP